MTPYGKGLQVAFFRACAPALSPHPLASCFVARVSLAIVEASETSVPIRTQK